MTESSALSDLRRRIAAIEPPPSIASTCVATGHAAIDLALGGGLARGRVHEVFALDAADASCAAGFAAMLARRLGGGIVWLREETADRQGGQLHAAGLVEIGIDPDRLILGLLPDPLAVLRAAADVVRCPDVGIALIELWRDPRRLDLTASRRLALAAEESGVTAIILRIAAEPSPSAAQTRWAVRAAASVPLAADAPGHPALEVELLRQRGRAQSGVWRVEWDREQTSFRAPALSGAVVSLPAGRSAGADGGARLRRA
ncbi:ImuA family protein [Sphingomonas sp. 37zxx]|uniref:ImuA family protein n=1 Tax=Sphingomonas sp. 37zxx TaxID=1550073 RepID=UPI00053BF6BF|nr:hypothetical protein [Sphingomonas sp. 37zxx]